MTDIEALVGVARASINEALDDLEAALQPPPPPEPTGPAILGIDVVPAQTSAQVTITLDVAAPCRTEFRVAGAQSWTAGPDETSYDHSTHVQALPGLVPDTDYEVRAIAYDEDGETVSEPVGFTTTGAQAGLFPPTVIGRTYVGWSPIAEPGYLEEVKDPNFAGSITRITPDGANWRAQYPRLPAWNADGSLLLLARDGKRLLDGDTYADLGARSVTTSRTIWSALDPGVAWTTKGGDNRLYRTDVLGNTQVVQRQFSGFSSVNNGNGEGRQSNDDRYHALMAGGTTVLVYDAVDDSYATLTMPAALDWAGMSPSGQYVVVGFSADGTGTGQGDWAYTRTGTPVRNLSSGGHGDVCVSGSGEDAYVSVGIAGGARWRARRIGDGQVTDVSDGMGGHVSGVCHQLPGWVLLSSHYANGNDEGWDQLALCRIDGSMEARILGHARTIQTTAQYQYQYSTHAVVSPDGTRATYGGGWQRLLTGNAVARGYAMRVAPS